MAIASFHFSTLEEYYTGGLFLGPGNGVSDGSAAVISIFIYMGMYGNEWTQTALPFIAKDFKISDACVWFVIISNIVIVLLCIFAVFKHQNREILEDEITGEELVLSAYILQILGYFIPQLMLTSLMVIGKSPLMYAKVPKNTINPLWIMLLLQSFLMQHLTCSV